MGDTISIVPEYFKSVLNYFLLKVLWSSLLVKNDILSKTPGNNLGQDFQWKYRCFPSRHMFYQKKNSPCCCETRRNCYTREIHKYQRSQRVLLLVLLNLIYPVFARSVDPNQTAPPGAVWSGSTLLDIHSLHWQLVITYKLIWLAQNQK